MPHGLPPDLPLHRPDEVSDLEWFVLEVQRINGCERTKAAVLELIKAQRGKVIRFTYRVLVRPDQVRRARQLIEAGNSTPTVRDALISAYGCSTRHAYNLIQEALNQRHKDHGQSMRLAQQHLFTA